MSKYLLSKKCRTLFSTHYHELTREYLADGAVLIYHMSAIEDEDQLVFLYTVSAGPCSKSHGFNAAKLAGLPGSIIEDGLAVADDFEREQKNLVEFAQILGCSSAA